MSFKSRDLTVKLSGEGGQCDGCTRTRPDCGGCTPTPDCGGCSVSQDGNDDCTRTRDNYYEQPDPGGAGLALLRQQLQETLGAELR